MIYSQELQQGHKLILIVYQRVSALQMLTVRLPAGCPIPCALHRSELNRCGTPQQSGKSERVLPVEAV